MQHIFAMLICNVSQFVETYNANIFIFFGDWVAYSYIQCVAILASGVVSFTVDPPL